MTSVINKTLSLLRRIPLSLLLFTIITTSSILTATIFKDNFATLMKKFGVNLPELLAGHFWRLWISLFFTSLPGPQLMMLVILLLGVGSLEYFFGTKIAAVSFFIFGSLASIITLFLLWPLDILGISFVKPTLYELDMGSSSASLLCWAMVLKNTKGRWRNFFLAVTLIGLLLLLILEQKSYNLEHFSVFLIGFYFFGFFLNKLKD